MLTELVIRDLTLIEAATVELSGGLNALTGETGSGKSLFVGALELLRGEAPRGGAAAWVRREASQARVEGRFVIGDPAVLARLRTFLAEELPELADELPAGARELELVLGRTLSAEGKTRAHVNQRPVPLKALHRLAGFVLEIHGQNDHQRLLEPLEQLRLFDAHAGLERALEDYAAKRALWLERDDELTHLEERAAERRGRLELLRFQKDELTAAKLTAGEHARLLEERELLRGAEALRTELGGLVDALVEGDGAALGRLQTGARTLERWAERLPRLAGALEALRTSAVHLEEASTTLASVLASAGGDPARLEELETRLDELERLGRKYRATPDALLEVLAMIENELAHLEEGELGKEELEQLVAAALTELEGAARALAKARKAAAPKLEKAIQGSLATLGLASARFEVGLTPRGPSPRERFGPHGAEDLEFLLAANPGEPRRPLRHVASGGEAARIMLALRSVLCAGDKGRTLVFDEIDSGVGGRLGPEVGACLRTLAANHQVLCVTHLPAIAAVADRHLSISKEVQGGRTLTTIVPLEGEARVSEVADMIAGGADEKTARAEARRLLKSAK